MTLIKTSILSGIATIIRVTAMFIINKIVAVYVGSSGIAIIGQFQNFIAIIMTFSNGAISQGIVKYTAQYQTIQEKQKIFSTSVSISLICSFVISIILLIFAGYFSNLILKTQEFDSVFRLFGLTIFLFSLNTVLICILNGQKEIKKYTIVNICGSFISLIVSSSLVYFLNLLGALYAMVINQSIVFFVTLFFVVKSDWFKFEYFKHFIDKDSFLKLSKYSLMAIVSASVVPVSHLFIRNYLGENLGWDSAGYWQGIWYISSMYLMLVTTTLGVYYLPRLSEIEDKNELKSEIIYGYKIIMPIVILASLMIFLLKDYIILIAFSKEFMPMRELFAWQMIGDCIKIASWLIGYLMLAKAMTKLFIFSEIFFSASFVLMCVCFVNLYGLVGMTYAYCLNYIIYFVFLIFIWRNIK